ncbi:MAG: cupin domain-containing protein [Planctomycetota bacterium]
MSDAPTGNGPFDLSTNFAHLGVGATAVPEPAFDGMAWYQGYGERHASDGAEARLVSLHTFSEPWGMWEMHPRGAELVLVTAGRLTLIQEQDGVEQRIELSAGQYAINPPGTWHTADASAPATAVFITAGVGTQHRPR